MGCTPSKFPTAPAQPASMLNVADPWDDAALLVSAMQAP